MSDHHRLSRIETLWSVVRRAHGDEGAQCQSAQRELVDRYGFAIRRYLMAALRDETAVDEVFQEFSLAFVKGDYRGADPQRGKFRSFLKTILFRLVADYRRSLYRQESPADLEDHVDDVVEDHQAQMDDQFVASWRESLLGRTWGRLETYERDSGKPYFTVLRYRVDHAELKSPELAIGLTKTLGKPISSANARVLIHRARDKFANLLLDEIIPSLRDGSWDELEEELIDLRLVEYCSDALRQRREALRSRDE